MNKGLLLRVFAKNKEDIVIALDEVKSDIIKGTPNCGYDGEEFGFDWDIINTLAESIYDEKMSFQFVYMLKDDQ